MPELPEVETLRRELKLLAGKTIARTTIQHSKMVVPLSPTEFGKQILQATIQSINRRAKVLIFTLSNDKTLLLHLKMTGQLIYQAPGYKPVVGGHPQKGGLDNLPNRFTHLWFDFTDGSHLYFNDMRKFGWAKLVSPQTATDLLSHLGVEPLSQAFTLDRFKTLVTAYPKRSIKQVLLDQTIIAGIGNIYADEACFLAKILPMRTVSSLKPKELKKLHESIIAVLKLSIQKKGTSARTYVRSDGQPGGFNPYLNVYGRSNQVCKRCKTTIARVRFQGRGTHFCPHCQKAL